MGKNFVGASVNVGGTTVATAKPLGTNKMDTAKESQDALTVVQVGPMVLPVKAAINMGYLQRNAAGVLVELNPPQPTTRVG